MEGSIPTRPHHPRIDETLEVVAERRGRHIHMGLNGAGSGAFRARLDDVSQDREPNRVPESPELLSVLAQFSAHLLSSNLFEARAQAQRYMHLAPVRTRSAIDLLEARG